MTLLTCSCVHAPCAVCPSQLVDELLAFWSLEDYETALEELEEALIVSCTPLHLAIQRLIGRSAFSPMHARPWLLQSADFGPKTALKIVDKVRDAIKSGKVKTSDEVKTQLKVRFAVAECAREREGARDGWSGGGMG